MLDLKKRKKQQLICIRLLYVDRYFTWYGFVEVNVKKIVNENVFQ